MAKYTDEQIKKGAECCLGTKVCSGCPFYEEDVYCRKVLAQSIFDIINRQEAEIERSQDEIAEYQNRVLCSKGLILTKSLTEYDELINDIASEAIKEFAERLKKSAFDCDVSFGFGREHYTEAVTVFEIDNLVKEMVGEGE